MEPSSPQHSAVTIPVGLVHKATELGRKME